MITLNVVTLSVVIPDVVAPLRLLPKVSSKPFSLLKYMLRMARGCIFSRVRPLYEQAVSDLDRSMHRSLCV
jgi:hypothetical protein